MKKIFFTKSIEDLKIDFLEGDTILINHPLYKKLPIVKNSRYMSLDEFKMSYTSVYFENLVIVGLNRIITPSNRCDMFNDFIQTMTRSKTKISIDTEPFIGEPWRAWYHFDVTNSDKWNVPHGFAIETEWKKWFYRDALDCRFSGKNIKNFKGDVIESDLHILSFEVRYSGVSENENEWYNEVKEHVIKKFATPKSMINSLLKECNKKFNVCVSFDSFRNESLLVVPDIGVYHFVIEENLRRKKIYNEMIK